MKTVDVYLSDYELDMLMHGNSVTKCHRLSTTMASETIPNEAFNINIRGQRFMMCPNYSNSAE